ncbi:MAG TPA: hypothetical protein VHD32_17730 [Candidatus Didemnitutus sp.]|nr:hypothetical protein [Candidatus Didemnitutus sp.]
MITRLCCWFLVSLFAAGCVIMDPLAETFGGPWNVGVVRQPDKVDACILHSGLTADRRMRYDETDFVAVPSELAAPLQAALLNERTYLHGIENLCAPRYRVRLRFHRGRNIVAVDFCFDCGILAIYRNGSQVDQEYFGSGIFLASMKRLFPGDPLLAQAK